MRRTVAVAVTAVLTLAGCGGGTETTQDQASSAAQTEASGSSAESDSGSNTGSDTGSDSASSGAEQAPSLVVDKIGGGQIEIADLLGQDVVLWFWAPW